MKKLLLMFPSQELLIDKRRDCRNTDTDGDKIIDSLDMILLRRTLSEK